ncbi:hypothetical protein I5192_01475 [Ruegeria sp. SCSIO 43209]|uniref:hypothetical protein n=1 Tax=Ruegeria sp. SCSIO 43209 TaxID=2793010 RepID=UPI00147B0C3F|nr:hypothetical protein [Ruegeria sp. SCSIO 43209]UAB89383.1 hypothetical protein I5192_01475 [Ruegeria sp. SCSIO 43209]
MKKAALLLALLPAAAVAEERVFECEAPDAEHPEMAARLVKYDGQQKGHITIGDIDKDVDVFPGLDTLTYLYVGEDYTLNYNVHPEKGTFDYSASGSKSGWGKGTCVETTGQ